MTKKYVESQTESLVRKDISSKRLGHSHSLFILFLFVCLPPLPLSLSLALSSLSLRLPAPTHTLKSTNTHIFYFIDSLTDLYIIFFIPPSPLRSSLILSSLVVGKSTIFPPFQTRFLLAACITERGLLPQYLRAHTHLYTYIYTPTTQTFTTFPFRSPSLRDFPRALK